MSGLESSLTRPDTRVELEYFRVHRGGRFAKQGRGHALASAETVMGHKPCYNVFRKPRASQSIKVTCITVLTTNKEICLD